MTLHKVNKNTIKAMLRKGEIFKGYIAPSKVINYHINRGWHIGMAVEFYSISQMEEVINAFQYYNCNSELGNRVAFWTEL